MPTDLVVPQVGESITEVQIGPWHKKAGEACKKDEVLVEIETDKVTQELYAPADGVIVAIAAQEGETATVGAVIGRFEVGAAGSAPAASTPAAASKSGPEPVASAAGGGGGTDGGAVMPAAQRLLDEHKLNAADVPASGPGGRLLKEDVLAFVASGGKAASGASPAACGLGTPAAAVTAGARDEEVVPMTSLRKRIATNLVKAQQTAALLTTFNELDMTQVMAVRSRYKEQFEKTHGVKLGFMSFFVRAAVEALKQSPAINAEIRGTDIVYKNYYDIGIAIGGGKGLVVPVLRNAERMSFADIEKTIGALAGRAKNNKLKLDELMGGSFTITNGGIYGSMMSTPIVNPPQSGVLGMHNIVRRPIAVGKPGKDERIEIRPMMYLALTYDHRIVDGKEAVTCLKRMVDLLQDPARMLMEV
ncbi:MAG: 2-oxoglutarate dehydrogenase complex dihydrolipoyllysine-residue succinyltransferase [Algisphaera sp.]